MSLLCFFGRHRPLLTSIVERQDRFTALCEDCSLPIERSQQGRWMSSEPLVGRDRAA